MTLDSGLAVVTSYYNPAHFKSRHRLFAAFCTYMAQKYVPVYAEAAVPHGQDMFSVPGSTVKVMSKYTSSVLWHKEALLNHGLDIAKHQYVAWMDADIAFMRPDWIEATFTVLQKCDVVQMFSQACDLDASGEVYQTSPGFVYYQEQLGKKMVSHPDGVGTQAHKVITPYGFAWAARREWLERVGGLCDTAILGSGDSHTAWALYGDFDRSLPRDYTLHKDYSTPWLAWQEKARDTKVGYVPGAIVHYWHGDRKNRQYDTRWEILSKHSFSPKNDLVRGENGLWQWKDENSALANDVKAYFLSRKEDE